MRILELSQWYVPEPDIKVHLLAKDLTARGHQVTCITGFPNYPSGKLYEGYRLRWRQWEWRDGVHVLRLPLYPDHSRSVMKRILNYVSFAASATALGPWLCGPADVMWVYHPPLTIALPAFCIALIRRVPYIYAVHDLWPETLASTGMMASPTLEKILAAFAKIVYRHAAALIVLSPGFKRNLVRKGVPPDKIHIYPNWADEDVYRPVARDPALAAEYQLAGKFNVMYGGNLGAAQALDNVLDAADGLRDLADVQFVFIGDGVDRERLRQTAERRDLRNVRFIAQQPPERMPYFFAWADALLIHLKRDPLFEITTPGKTTAYLACGRPIICALHGDTADMVQNARAGLVCPPEDPGALVRTIRELYAMPADKREALGQSGRRAFVANYTRAVLMDRYEALFAQVARRDGKALSKIEGRGTARS